MQPSPSIGIAVGVGTSIAGLGVSYLVPKEWALLFGWGGVILGVSIIVIALVLHSTRRDSGERALPDLSAVDFMALSGKIGKAIAETLPGILKAEEAIEDIHHKYDPQYLAELGSQRHDKALRALAIKRREASEINQQLDRIDLALPKIEELTTMAAQGFTGMAEYCKKRGRGSDGDIRIVTDFRQSTLGLLETMNRDRVRGESFQRFMAYLHGDSADLNAASTRGTATAAKLVSAFGQIRQSCRAAVKTADDLLRIWKRKRR